MVTRPQIGELLQSVQVKNQANKNSLNSQKNRASFEEYKEKQKNDNFNSTIDAFATFGQIGASLYDKYKKNKDQADLSKGTLEVQKYVDDLGFKIDEAILNNKATINDDDTISFSDEDIQTMYNDAIKNIENSGYSSEVTDSLTNNLKSNFEQMSNKARTDVLQKQFKDNLDYDNMLLETAMKQDAKKIGLENMFNYSNTFDVLDKMTYLSEPQKKMLTQSAIKEINFQRAKTTYNNDIGKNGITKTIDSIMNNPNIPDDKKNEARSEATQSFNDIINRGLDFANNLVEQASQDVSKQVPIKSGVNMINFAALKEQISDYIEQNNLGQEASGEIYTQLESYQANAILKSPLFKTAEEKQLLTDEQLEAENIYINDLKKSGAIASFDNIMTKSIYDVNGSIASQIDDTNTIISNRNKAYQTTLDKMKKEQEDLIAANAKNAEERKKMLENYKKQYSDSIDASTTTIKNQIILGEISGNEGLRRLKAMSTFYLDPKNEIDSKTLADLNQEELDSLIDYETDRYITLTQNVIDDILDEKNHEVLGSNSPIFNSKDRIGLYNYMSELKQKLKSNKDLTAEQRVEFENYANDYIFNRALDFDNEKELKTGQSFLDIVTSEIDGLITAKVYDESGSFARGAKVYRELENLGGGVYFDFNAKKMSDRFKFATPQVEEKFGIAKTYLEESLSRAGIEVDNGFPPTPKLNSDGSYTPVPLIKSTDGKFYTKDGNKILTLNKEGNEWIDIPEELKKKIYRPKMFSGEYNSDTTYNTDLTFYTFNN